MTDYFQGIQAHEIKLDGSATETATKPSDGNDGTENTEGAINDFLALAHAHEWASFYDSFDKLVQDNMARSRDLLQKAMDLPAIADREVAQAREELAVRLAAERDAHAQALVGEREKHRAAMMAEYDRQRQTLEALHRDVASSRAQAERLANDVAAMIESLGILSTRVLVSTQQIGVQHENTAPELTPKPEQPTPIETEVDDLRWPDDVSPEPVALLKSES